MIISV